MLSLGGDHRVFLCRHAVDFRKAHDGLCALVRDQIRDDPFSGDVFVFHNGPKDRVKLLLWDRNGFWLLYKRLEQGTFPFAVEAEDNLSSRQFNGFANRSPLTWSWISTMGFHGSRPGGREPIVFRTCTRFWARSGKPFIRGR